jgi:predicted MFS family arabinose efflux permease
VNERSERPLLWLLAGIQFTLLLDFMVLMPLGPELMQSLRLSATAFGSLVSSYTLSSAIFGLSGLFWLGRFGRKATLMALYAGFVGATLGCALAPSSVGLFAARMLAGACAGLLWAVVMDLIVDVVPEERRGSAIGLVMSAYAVAAVAGVPLGLWLSSWQGFRAPFYLIAVLSASLLLAAWRIVPQGHTKLANAQTSDEPIQRLLREPGLVGGWLLTFAVVSAGFLMIPYLGTHFVANLGVTSEQLGLVYLCGGVVTFFTSRWVGAWVDRAGPLLVLAVLLVASVLPHLLVTHLERAPLWGVAASFVLFMTLTSGRMIPTMALLTSRAPGPLRARYLAVNTAVSDGASGAAAWLSAHLLTTSPSGHLLGFDRVGVLAVGVSLSALALLLALQRTYREAA